MVWKNKITTSRVRSLQRQSKDTSCFSKLGLQKDNLPHFEKRQVMYKRCATQGSASDKEHNKEFKRKLKSLLIKAKINYYARNLEVMKEAWLKLGYWLSRQ